MERLAETTPNCPAQIIDEFNKKFKHNHSIALPNEVNGIHKISIYRADHHVMTPIVVPEKLSLVIPKTSNDGHTLDKS
jgi:hypothetical protein